MVTASADTLHIPAAGEWNDFSSLPAHALADGLFTAGVGDVDSEVVANDGQLSAGGVADSGFFLHRTLIDSMELQLHLHSPSPEGHSGLMIRDSIDPAAPFVFLGRDSTGDTVVLLRRSAEGPVEEVFREDRGHPWLRLVLGRDTVYAYDTAQRYRRETGGANWGTALGAWQVDLTGEEVGGVFVEKGIAKFNRLYQTRSFFWSEKTADTTAAVSSSAWSARAPLAGQVAKSETLYSCPADQMEEWIEFPVDLSTPGDQAIWLHLPQGNPAQVNVELEVDGQSRGFVTVPTDGPTTNGWVYVDRVAVPMGADGNPLPLLVRIWTELETDPAQKVYSAGGILYVDAVQAVVQRPTEWTYMGWQNHSSKLRRTNYGEPGNSIDRNSPNHTNSWNAGAYANEVILGDGSFLMRFPKNEKRVIAGITNTPEGNSNTHISYYFYGKNNRRVIARGGVSDTESFYDNQTWLGIERIGDRILFWKNDGLRGVSNDPSTLPLGFDCSIKDEDGKISSARYRGFAVHRDITGDLNGDGEDDSQEKTVVDDSSDDAIQSIFDVDLSEDIDNDGLTSAEELALEKPTNTANPDTDGDGLLDGEEVNLYHTDPRKADSDGDRLSDGDEVKFSRRFEDAVFLTGGNPLFDPNRANTDSATGDTVGDFTEYEILEYRLDELGEAIETLSTGQIDDDSDYDGDLVTDLAEFEDRTSAVDAEDYFLPIEFGRFGDTLGATAVVETNGTIESTRLTRDAGAAGEAGGISHHRVRDGSRVRFRFANPTVGASIGFTVLLLPDPTDPDYRVPAKQAFPDNVGSEPDFSVAIEAAAPGKARIVAAGEVLPIGDPAAGLFDFDVTPGDLLELRIELGEENRIVVEKDFKVLTEHGIGAIDLETYPMVLSAFVPDENNGIRSEIVDGRYRRMEDPDIDLDGLPDAWEEMFLDADETDAFDHLEDLDPGADDDVDGLTNLEEYEHGTNPLNPDTDGDGMWDGWEDEHELDARDPSDANVDSDDDGLTNLEEFLNLLQFADSQQPWIYYGTTDPNLPDSDGDGINDYWETMAPQRDPLVTEEDLEEIDSDGDGMPDVWEVAVGLDLLDPGDAARDDDYDNLTNLQEYQVDGEPFPVWSRQEIEGGLGEYGLALPLFRDAAPGEGSMTPSGRVARVHQTKFDFQLEVWEDGTWETEHWLARVGALNWSGHVRINDLGMAAVVLGRMSSSGMASDLQVRIVDSFGIVRVIGEDLPWKDVVQLDITNSGYVSGLVKKTDNTYQVFRWRLQELETFDFPDLPSASYGGIEETGEWSTREIFRSFTQEELDLVSTFSPATNGTIFTHPDSGDTLLLPVGADGALYRKEGGQAYLLHNFSLHPLPLPAGTTLDPMSGPYEIVIADLNRHGDAVGWWEDRTVRDPSSPDTPAGDLGVFWKGSHELRHERLGDGEQHDFRYHRITDSGILLSSRLERTQDETEVVDEFGATTIVSGDPYFLRRWFVHRPYRDDDRDGMSDDWEAFHSLSSPDGDADQDGLSNRIEFALQTDPNSAHSDGDGLEDGFEVASGFSPLEDLTGEIDYDGDGLLAAEEAARGTDPLSIDTDGDGITDEADPSPTPAVASVPEPYFEERSGVISWTGAYKSLIEGDDVEYWFAPSAHGDDSCTADNPDHFYTTPPREQNEDPYTASQLDSYAEDFRIQIIGNFDDYGKSESWSGLGGGDDFNLLSYSYYLEKNEDDRHVAPVLNAQRVDIRCRTETPFRETTIFEMVVAETIGSLGGGGEDTPELYSIFFVFPEKETVAQIIMPEEGNSVSLSVIEEVLRAKPPIPADSGYSSVDVVRFGLLPVEIVAPEEGSDSTGYVADDMVAATNLKIAKMEKSLDDQGSLDAAKDIDRFYLRIPGVANSNLGAVSVKVTTVENPDDTYNETATVMNLNADGDDLVSGPMILVSDTVDDNHDQNDNADDDPTHLAQIGGKFRIESITIDGKESSSQIDIEIKEEKTVTINAVVFSDSGMTKAQSEQIIETQVRERYAQVGLKIEVGSVEEKDPPTIPNRANDSSEIAIYESEDLAGKYAEHGFWAVMKGRSGDDPDNPQIYIFFCKKLLRYRVPSIPQLPEELNGYAWHSGKMPAAPYALTAPYNDQGDRIVNMAAFANNCFISVSLAQGKPFTVAHEVGHLLTRAAHFEDYAPGNQASDAKRDQNLMRGTGTSDSNTLDASKRLQQHQEDRIHGHPAVK